MALHVWKDLVADGSVRGIKYSFGFGNTNCVAARLDDGSWMVLSPAAGLGEDQYAALGGSVSALVAPNGYHHLGQPAWRARFPAAVSYAPDGALERLGKKSAGIPYRPLAELVATLPARIQLLTPAGLKKPDLVARISAGPSTVWYAGDIISNTQPGDLKFLPRMIFTMLGGGTGYRFNRVPAMVYIGDKKAWKASVKAAMNEHPPTVVVPAHGDIVVEDVAARSQALLAH